LNTYDKIIAIKDASRSDHVLRIISECIYACELSKTAGGSYDELIRSAVDFLYLEFQNSGCVTIETARKCEDMLLPLSEKAKSYKLYCVSHAHIDMNWMWSLPLVKAQQDQSNSTCMLNRHKCWTWWRIQFMDLRLSLLTIAWCPLN